MATMRSDQIAVPNDEEEALKFVFNSTKDFLLADPFVQLLRSRHDGRDLQNLSDKLLLQEHDAVLEEDEEGSGWITVEDAQKLAKVLNIQDIFEAVTQGSEIDTDEDEPLPKRPNTDVGIHLGSPLKKLKPYAATSITTFTHDLDIPTPVSIQPARKPISKFSNEERVKLETLLQQILFPEAQAPRFESVLAELQNSYPNTKLNFNISIDEYGNTPLHWLCSIANIGLIKDLIRNGSDRLLSDKSGETCLVKAVKSVNNYDSGTFEELLDYLYPCLILVDDMNRTVLHHIVITSGMPGCAAAAKYYLDILMGWIVKKQGREIFGEVDPVIAVLDLKWFITNIVNARDVNGDTCLNIASRLGNVSIVEALLDYGADPQISNNSGLRPVDFGAGASQNDTLAVKPKTENGHMPAGPDPSALINSIQSLLKTISQDYDTEMSQHKEQLRRLHSELDTQRELLATSRDKLARARQLRDDHCQLTEQLANIQLAIREEDANFKKVSAELGIDDESFDMAEFDADEPFRVDFIYEFLEKKLQEDFDGNFQKLMSEVSVSDLAAKLMEENSGREEFSIPPAVLLKARIRAYERNEEKLDESLGAVYRKQSDLESRFRRVLSLCLKVDEDKVDGMLDGLLQAISTEDPEDIDTEEMQDFLKKHAV